MREKKKQLKIGCSSKRSMRGINPSNATSKRSRSLRGLDEREKWSGIDCLINWSTGLIIKGGNTINTLLASDICGRCRRGTWATLRLRLSLCHGVLRDALHSGKQLLVAFINCEHEWRNIRGKSPIKALLKIRIKLNTTG